MENCGKNVKNVRSGREKRKGENKRERGRLGSSESRRPVSRYRKRRWNFACHVPSTFARKATMFEPPRKNTKMREKHKKRKFEQSAHWFVTANRPSWHLHRPRRPQVLITVLKPAKMPQNSTTTVSNSAKIPRTTAKTTN